MPGINFHKLITYSLTGQQSELKGKSVTSYQENMGTESKGKLSGVYFEHILRNSPLAFIMMGWGIV